MKNISIEYAHIYTNKQIDEEHAFSLEILENIKKEETEKGNTLSLVIMIDDYSFPDPSFDYEAFSSWLKNEGYPPDSMIRESMLIPLCDEVLKLIQDDSLKEEIAAYIRSKKYPCSLFISTWYLLRLGCISSVFFSKDLVGEKLINILPSSFKPFEDKAVEIIRATKFSGEALKITNNYFEGRMIV